MSLAELYNKADYKDKSGMLFNDDCMNVLSQINNESIDLIVTDVPYPTTQRGNSGNSGGMLQKEINKKGKVFNFNSIDCSVYAPEFYRILKDGSHCYVMTNHINLLKMLNTFTDLRTEEEIRGGVEAVWLSLYQEFNLE